MTTLITAAKETRILTQRTNNFYKAPGFTFADLFVYLVEKKGYDKESLSAFASLRGYDRTLTD